MATTEQPQTDPAPQAERREPWLEERPSKLLAALAAGLVFGFLLQKGGVAKFDILIGVLLLENFVVVKVMLTAIAVGMIGCEGLRRAGVLEPQISETNWGANILGGLVFGVGFALLAYCPGTNAAAIGQGNLDALVGVAGLLLGSLLYASVAGTMSRTVKTWGQRGKATIPELVGVRRGVFVAVAVPILVGAIAALEWAGL